jgi:hypothetical protein
MVILYNFSDDLKPVQKIVPSTQKVGSNSEQALNKQRTGYCTSPEQALLPSINNINNINNTNILNKLNLDESKKNENEDTSGLKNESELKKEMPDAGADGKGESSSPAFADYSAEHTANRLQKGSAEKEKAFIPNLEEIKSYFLEQSFPELEAQKFFNHYSSNGWLIGGKSSMVDWRAAANNWMLNSYKFHNDNSASDRSKNLNVQTDKDYSEPL